MHSLHSITSVDSRTRFLSPPGPPSAFYCHDPAHFACSPLVRVCTSPHPAQLLARRTLSVSLSLSPTFYDLRGPVHTYMLAASCPPFAFLPPPGVPHPPTHNTPWPLHLVLLFFTLAMLPAPRPCSEAEQAARLHLHGGLAVAQRPRHRTSLLAWWRRRR